MRTISHENATIHTPTSAGTRRMMSTKKSNDKLIIKSETNSEEVRLSYLQYSNPESDKLSFPVQVRERYLTPGSLDASLQAIGPELQIVVWSERKNMLIRVPLETWYATREFSGTLSNMGGSAGILSVGRFENRLRKKITETEDGKIIDVNVWTVNMEHE